MSADIQLTVIVPFLNERYEVENTLRSIREHSNDDVNILLINDASNDGFDYKGVATKYDAQYVENQERMGVAASRDLGVGLCKTPFFLFLDSHMRFYNDAWVGRIVSELNSDNRSLLCCQSKSLELVNGLLTHRVTTSPYGAYVNLTDGRNLVDVAWLPNAPLFDDRQSLTVPIACVLGAGYACCREYWNYLKGLEGLKYYGSDEPYISMKVWLEGGSCKLLKDVVLGHIYRKSKPPYETQGKFIIYNRLFIAEVLFPDELKKQIFSTARYSHKNIFPEVLLMLHKNREAVNDLKTYYRKIFTHDFSFFQQLNDKYHPPVKMKNILVDGVDEVLNKIRAIIKDRHVDDIGILQGRTGAAIFLFHYGRMSGDDSCREEAERMLEGVLKDIKKDTYYGFSTGLCGIGWGINYLYEAGFVEGDINEILEDFDKKIIEINPLRITDTGREYGLGGIVLYVMARLYSLRKEGARNPFDEDYLSNIYARVKEIVDQKDVACDSIGVFLHFMSCYESGEGIVQPDLYDVFCLLNHSNTPLEDLNLGLTGVSGVGLNLIFNNII